MHGLAFEISDNRITISDPSLHQQVIFTKELGVPQLVSHEVLWEQVDASREEFLAKAWKAAHAAACQIGGCDLTQV